MKILEEWKKVDRVVLYGFGRQGKLLVRQLNKEYRVEYIIDNSFLEKKEWMEITVTTEEEYFNNYHKAGNKFLIAAAGISFLQIKESLNKRGFIEDRDYMQLTKFLTVKNWLNYKKVYLGRVGITVTEKCSLKCEKCSECMPYIQNPKDADIKTLKMQTDKIFKVVDFISGINLVGGTLCI